jgi:ABC-2 type transport system ATP-binding protein
MNVVLEDVTKRYSAHEALRGVNLTIGRGMFGLLGPNGAGKTTLLRILATLLRPSSGRVFIGAFDLSQGAQRTAARSALGYLPQDLGLYPDLTGRELLDYIGLLKRLYDRSARRQQIAALLDVVNLTEYADRQIKTYSGGMRRRLGVAQALLGDPQALVIDEPTAGLDPEERIRLRTLLTSVAEDRVVILSTHLVEDVTQTCKRVAVLDRGALLFDGQTQTLIEAAAGHAWQFLAAPGFALPAEMHVISALPHPEGTIYHVVGPTAPQGDAQAVQPLAPTLEDGYVWLRQGAICKQTASTVN